MSFLLRLISLPREAPGQPILYGTRKQCSVDILLWLTSYFLIALLPNVENTLLSISDNHERGVVEEKQRMQVEAARG